MKIVCAWCDKDMGSEDGAEEIRYSVCTDCLKKFNVTPEKEKVPDKPENK